MTSLHDALYEFGESLNPFFDKLGDKFESAFKTAGSASNAVLDSVGNALEDIPCFGQKIDVAFDKAGDSAEEFFISSGEYINDTLDQFGNDAQDAIDDVAYKLSWVDTAQELGVSTGDMISAYNTIQSFSLY